ncbi:MAG: response regulator [Verrucomicrobiota bacterium]
MSDRTKPTPALVGMPTGAQSRAATGTVRFAVLDHSASAARSWAKLVVHSGLLALVAGLCCTTLAEVPDPISSELEKNPVTDFYQQDKNQRIAREQQELYRVRIAISDAVGQDVPSAAAVRRVARKPVAAAAAPTATNWLEANQTVLLSLVAAFLAAGFIIRRFGQGLMEALNAAFNPWVAATASSAGLTTKVRAEEQALSEFLAVFRAGPGLEGAAAGDPAARAAAVKSFYEKAARTLDTQRRMLQEIDRTTEDGGRQKMLAALRWELHVLRSEAGVPELLPVWQLAFAIEGLLKQLTDNAANVTLSTLRTLAGGVELLNDLCRSGVEPDLLTRQPLRLLAVDDDPISRMAVALALKRALNEPELAEDGEAALALATHQAYDVIFLDVQMPGMDGFEVCTKVHETEINRATPVVFVTCHTDFEARAKSTLSGGSELIGKPFLTFEITVKALTLALRGRLAARVQNAGAAGDEIQTADARQSDAAAVSTSSTQAAMAVPAGAVSGAELAGDSQEIASVFLARASAHLAPLREAFQAIFQAPDEATRQDLLADVFLRIHSFTPKDDLPALHPAIQLSAALDGLLRKLLENPQNAKGSTLVTLATGIELLDDLCALRSQTDLLTNPPIRMLVVDDDPVARRAVTVALQMTFEKPDSADDGDAAVALATTRSYDVIFMDVQMPGIDGFEACAQIRQTTTNAATPVVFVTGHSDFKARTRMTASGGSDFVGKPFIISEITLKALAFALRGRLNKLALRTNEALPLPASVN